FRSLSIPLFFILFLARIFFRFKKSRLIYQITLVMLSVIFVINLLLISEVITFEIYKYKITQIEKIDTCEKAELQFDIDLKNQSLKYFTFGMGVDEEYQK